MSSGTSECPLCFETFSTSVIATHASSCPGSRSSKTGGQKRPGVPLGQETPKKPKQETTSSQPLADLMRPKTLDGYVGQDEALGSFWKPLLNGDCRSLPSLILWGPPGCGKTTLAHIIAQRCRESELAKFTKLSACTSGVADVKEVVLRAKNDRKMFKRNTVLFIDEIHRFNKIQQDAFLPHVEDGTLTLIGATTENPSFSLNKALLREIG